jgi:sterol desaturase/sphingolipid hydroxylase (fatty acid hydroxylase superfamily)
MRDIIQDAIPFFIITIIIEIFISIRLLRDDYESKDTWSSLGLGIGNVLSGLVTKGFQLGVFALLYQYRLFDLPSNDWWVWVLLFFGEDFSYYWFHRKSHEIRFFWASHMVHHTSENYTLATALRQTWTGHLTGAFVFWCWLPLIGFEPWLIVMFQSISLLYQYWIHTELIKAMPSWFEFIFNTPSHHRVHHGSDIKYLDKNHAGILIIWDRIFGTFKSEEEHPTYGLIENVNTFNPIKIAFHEWRKIGRDLIKAPSFSARIKYIFGAPGWRHDGGGTDVESMRKS